MRISWALVGCALAMTGCEEEEVFEVRTRVRLSIAEGDQVKELCEGDNANCQLSFGEIPLATWTDRAVLVKNPVSLPLRIADIRLSEDSDPSFVLDAQPMLLRGGITSQFVVRARPVVDGNPITGTVEILSDASNGESQADQCQFPDYSPQHGDVAAAPRGDPEFCTLTRIALTATGIDRGIPRMLLIPVPGTPASQVDTALCDFGALGQNDVATCRVQIRNVGERVLTLDDIAFAPSNPSTRPDPEADPVPVFKFAGSITTPIMIEAGAAANLVVSFTPPGLNTYEGSLTLQTNDPDFPAPDGVTVRLRGLGHQAPVALCDIYAVDSSLQFERVDIEPLSDVQLTGEASYSDVVGATIDSFEWRIIDAPDGSTAVLTDTSAIRPGFEFENSGRMRGGLDLSGPYAVQLLVRDSFGVRSQPCVVEFEAIPQDAVSIQLIWDHPSSDVDIHLLKSGDAQVYRDQNMDCYYRNCRGTPLAWGGELDLDDVNGYGPENITIEHPGLAEYLIGAHYFTARSAGGVKETVATVRVHLYGMLACEVEAMLEDTGSWWESLMITTERSGFCEGDDDCRDGHSCIADETALVCQVDDDCPADYACGAGATCEQKLCRGSRLVCQPTHRPVDPIPPQN